MSIFPHVPHEAGRNSERVPQAPLWCRFRKAARTREVLGEKGRRIRELTALVARCGQPMSPTVTRPYLTMAL